MAETVQAVMDSMVPAFHDFIKLKIFTEEEIKALVDRRREWEYKLIRKSRSSSSSSSPSSPSQFHVEAHIHFIFTRALRKFKSDVSMWMQYIDFAKKNDSSKKLSRIYAEALQIHPHSVPLWLSSAEWEFFSNNNAKSARVVMQRALRTVPKSEDLWLQYFNLELHYVQRMRGRREILQLEGVTAKSMEESPLFSGGIASIVYQNAVKSVPKGGLAFRLKFLEQCGTFPQTDKLEHEIMESIAKDFPDDPSAYISRAQYVLPDVVAALEIMDVGLVTSHDSDNYRIRYLGFIRETLDDEVAPDESVPLLTTKYQSVCQSPPTSSPPPSSSLALHQASLHLHLSPTSLTPISTLLSLFPPPTSLSTPDPNVTSLALLLSHAHLRMGDYTSACAVLLSSLRSLTPHSPPHLDAFASLAGTAVETLLMGGRVEEVEDILRGAPMEITEGLLMIYLNYSTASEGGGGMERVLRFKERCLMGDFVDIDRRQKEMEIIMEE
ncbi:hypothetical protein TrRE_jg7787 [Triparma retinervis]|uniref:U3 small nucleolar RNA-associated protein 6 N-terminal domain-containing protein n=1 Tax=Triparma retinervis TaxID=2557542 RepID=A0A9W7C9D7_9STRA|nr:hypothetical protein TrRE_jg7787 [Triparma retinervis]